MIMRFFGGMTSSQKAPVGVILVGDMAEEKMYINALMENVPEILVPVAQFAKVLVLDHNVRYAKPFIAHIPILIAMRFPLLLKKS